MSSSTADEAAHPLQSNPVEQKSNTVLVPPNQPSHDGPASAEKDGSTQPLPTRDLPLRPKRDQDEQHNDGHAGVKTQAHGEGDKGSSSSDHDSHSGGPLHAASDLKNMIEDKTQSLKDKAHPPGGFDSTPLPDFPAGYTVKFTFHRASNLPIADITSGACDAFIHATLTAAVPKRHKEDPDLVFRTRTIRRDTEPVWEQEWIVANIPRSGFRLKCRLYDEDYPDHDDRLGNVTYLAPRGGIDENWAGVKRQIFQVKKRMGSKRAYFLKAAEAAFSKNVSMTPLLEMSIEVLGRSEGPGAQVYTVGPTAWIQHFSPMIGRLTGVRVNKDENDDENSHDQSDSDKRKMKKYDFQANEIQLQGPVSPKLYHRYVEFRPFVGRMFSSHGLRGTILNKMLHKQHRRIYNFDSSTMYGTFPPCSQEASVQFLKMAHYDEGWRVYTYVLTLDGLLRFTETGKEFGIDLLSKHTMHSDVQTYIACSGEFFIRRRSHRSHHHSHSAASAGSSSPTSSGHGADPDRSHSNRLAAEESQGSSRPATSGSSSPPHDPGQYELVIDNDSGTYRPDKSILPELGAFLEKNFPGLHVSAMHWGDEELQAMKKKRHETKKKEGRAVHMVLNRSPSSESFSSSDESRLSDMDDDEDNESGGAHVGGGAKSKKELAWEMLEDPNRLKGLRDRFGHHHNKSEHKQHPQPEGGPDAKSKVDS